MRRSLDTLLSLSFFYSPNLPSLGICKTCSTSKYGFRVLGFRVLTTFL